MNPVDLVQRLLRRRSFYRAAFENQAGRAVLADLRRFCRAGESPLVVSPNGLTDAMATGVAIGRLEVFNRIAHHIHLSDAQLLQLKEEAHDD